MQSWNSILGFFSPTGCRGHCLFRLSLHAVFNRSGAAWRDFAILGKKNKIRITTSWICTRRLERRHRVRRRHSTWTFPRQRHHATFPNNAQEKATLTIQTEVKSKFCDSEKKHEFARRTFSFLFRADSGSVQDMSSPPKEKVETKGGHPPAGIAPRDCCYSFQASFKPTPLFPQCLKARTKKKVT